MPSINVPQSFKDSQYYNIYKSMVKLGLTKNQAITETNKLYIELRDDKCQQ